MLDVLGDKPFKAVIWDDMPNGAFSAGVLMMLRVGEGIGRWQPFRYLLGQRCRNWIRKGNSARDVRDWPRAAHCYSNALNLKPATAGILVQLGHALKEQGSIEAAEKAYRRAIDIDPDNFDTWVQLGHVLKISANRHGAIEAYRIALMLAGDHQAIKNELIALDAAHVIIESGAQMGFSQTALLELEQDLANIVKAVGDARSSIDYSADYDSFRKKFPVIPSPVHDRARLDAVEIIVRAELRSTAELKYTIESLLAQTDTFWRATICADVSIAAHSVATIAKIDRRFSFVVDVGALDLSKAFVLINAGCVFDQTAVAWFRYVRDRFNPIAAFCDHDMLAFPWRSGATYSNPVLHPAYDRDWFAEGHKPAAVLLNGSRRPFDINRPISGLLAEAAEIESPTHIPLPLVSIVDVWSAVKTAPNDGTAERSFEAQISQRVTTANPATPQSIAVIIPTRDCVDILEKAIDSLVQTGSDALRLEIIVVNNRSISDDWKRFKVEAPRRLGLRIIDADEPFNWSRFNNMALPETSADIIVFMNNDAEMLSANWDTHIRDLLARSDVGVVGARLLYPDRTVQHAGIVFGFGAGMPMHEGVGSQADDGGPNGRWLCRRSVGAVTGAFMAMRRSTVLNLDQFEEAHLPLGYNDVDMCLKARAAGLKILYAPDIQLIHHESKTRGMNVTRSQVAWDHAELHWLADKWGDFLFEDRTVNPRWARVGKPFQAYVMPSSTEIAAYVERSRVNGLARPER